MVKSRVLGMSADTYLCNDHRVRLGIFANGDAQQMAQLVSRGSAGCIAALDQMNPRSYVPGTQPWSGVQLTVHWGRLIGIYETIPSTILPLHLLSFANSNRRIFRGAGGYFRGAIGCNSECYCMAPQKLFCCGTPASISFTLRINSRG